LSLRDLDLPQEAEARYRALVEQLAEAQALAHVGSWEWDLSTERLTWSDELYRIFGLEPGSPVSYPDTLRYIHPDDHATIERLVAQALKDHQPFTCPQRVLRPGGAERMVEGRTRVEVDATGRAIRLYGTLQDVTERQRAEDAVRRAQQEFRDIFEYAEVGIFRASRAGRILLANQAFATLLGYDSPDELRALDLARDVYVDPDERARLVAEYEHRRGGWTLEIEWKKRDGTRFWVLLSSHAVKDEGGGTRYFEAFVQDITDRRRAQQELKRSRRRLQGLATRLEEAREQERKVMAREIHDELGQSLTALRMDLAWLSGRLPADFPELAARARRMIEDTERTIQTVRRLATALRPPILDDLGLVAAIEWQTEEIARRAALRYTLDLPGDVRLEEGLATAVFRILQEALTNVARHAGANAVRVSLQLRGDALLLEVSDDGRGIAPEQLEDRRSLGLLGMRERAMAWGGVLDVRRGPERGTAVLLRIPLAGLAHEGEMP
jgi:PAS domain S-box-containing protein